ncbi:hypothetical protein HNR46_002417 [Haloferula luteola]|uniref:Uncharacterized protein n=1 Tax=Haloferula luteola TaxID=595692 RepID=A0A840V9A9_9BACT|nr:hypothetical protein [Haloferula luteola]
MGKVPTFKGLILTWRATFSHHGMAGQVIA